MPMDGITLGFVARELNAKLAGGRIDKVVQPERDEIILTIRSQGENHPLLLSASAGCARAHITHVKKNNPLEPPMFCMLLRKHLLGGRVVEVRQYDCDRILEIVTEHQDEMGDVTRKTLICEFMGKHSNLIFVNAQGRIIESARRVTEEISSVREVLPGLRYERPPQHGKIPFDSVTAEALAPRLAEYGGTLQKALQGCVSGLSTQAARELAFRVAGDEDARMDKLDVATAAKRTAIALNHILSEEFAPQLLLDEAGAPMDILAFPYQSRAHLQSRRCNTLSEALDEFYRSRDNAERIKQKSAALHRVLKNNIERCEKKKALHLEALAGSQHMEEYRIKGELLTAAIGQAQKGQKSVSLINYYDPECRPIDVELDVKLSPAQNAQRYFKLYRKAASAQKLAQEQLDKTEEELAYLEGQMENLYKSTEEAELAEIRAELEKFGYVKAQQNRRQIKQLPPSRPMHFVSKSGIDILVGKNNVQNDKLTFTANANEIWLHAKDMPGSHVIIVSENPDDDTLLEAAHLAAKYSKGRNSSQVPVDYTRRKYVKKPSGAKPGFVIYTHQRTLYVTPELD